MSAELITPAESVRLCELERVIQKGKDTFVEVGTALAEIRDSRIYRATFKTFEDYCQKRWDFSQRQCDRLISAAKVIENLRPMGPSRIPCSKCRNLYDPTAGHICDDGKLVAAPFPSSERQARPLAKLPAEQQPAAWEKAQEIAKEEGKPVAARHVEAAVLEVMPKEDPEPLIVDGTGDDEEEEPRDSEKLSLLKSTWDKASKKDKAAFAAWINKNWKI